MTVEQAPVVQPTRVYAPGIVIPERFGGIPISTVDTLRPYIKALVYARPGAGKTYFASQASKVPAMSPVLYMTSDDTEADTLKQAAPDAVHLPVKKFQDFWDVYDAAAVGIRDPSKIPFRTIVIDTGTEAERMWMRDIMDELAEKGRPTGGEVNIDVPSVREWGQSISGVRRLVRAYRDLPVNFIMTAHEKEIRDNAGVTWYKPDFPGKLPHQIAGMFSCVWYVYVRAETETEAGMAGRSRKITIAEHRLLLTGYTEGFVCKTRAGTLPRVIEDPEMSFLFEKVTGRRAEDGEPIEITETPPEKLILPES